MTGQAMIEEGHKLAAQTPRAPKIVVFKAPQAPKLPVSPRIPLNPALGAVAGLGFSPLAALLAARVVRSRADHLHRRP